MMTNKPIECKIYRPANLFFVPVERYALVVQQSLVSVLDCFESILF
jgi:hypothetical protein